MKTKYILKKECTSVQRRIRISHLDRAATTQVHTTATNNTIIFTHLATQQQQQEGREEEQQHQTRATATRQCAYAEQAATAAWEAATEQVAAAVDAVA